MVIIGITGTIGAGKGTIVNFLTSTKNFKHYSVRAFLLREIQQRKLATNRDSMVIVANHLRQTHSPSYIVDQLMKEALNNNQDSVIESIRTEGEIISLRKHHCFHLFAVDAQPELRYKRIKLRNSETDHIDYKTFIENEQREYNSTNPYQQNLKKCIDLADYKFLNNGSIEDLHLQLEEVLRQLSL